MYEVGLLKRIRRRLKRLAEAERRGKSHKFRVANKRLDVPVVKRIRRRLAEAERRVKIG